MDCTNTRRFKFNRILLVIVCAGTGSLANAAVTVCPSGCAQASIQAGIDVALPGQTVNVRAGTYREAITINKPIKLKGLAGNARTIIDATGLGRSVVTMSVDATLQGFTLRGGSHVSGGGILVAAGTAVVKNNVIRNNRATTSGGGVWVNGNARATIVNNKIRDNVADISGGGVASGEYATVLVDNNKFIANQSRDGGAVVASSYATTTLTRNLFDRNRASYGGALYLSPYSSRPSNASPARTLTLERNTLRGNVASQDGGGIFVASYAFATVANNVVVKNRAVRGGGVYMPAYSFATVVNSTIADNFATEVGGVAVEGASGASIVDSIVWNNQNGQITQLPTSGPVVSYSVVQGGDVGTGTNIIDADPLFIDAGANDYRLRATSPAIDSGRNTQPDFGIATDFDGRTRPQDGDGLGVGPTGDGSDYDIGAFEAPAAPSTVPCQFVAHADGTVTDTRTGLMWVQDANSVGNEAWSAAQSRASGATTGGYNDWRLPTIDELASLYANLARSGSFDPTPFVNLAIDGLTDWHWSDTLSDPGCNAAWYCQAAYFDFQQGIRNTNYIAARLWIFPVRASGGPVCSP